MNDHRHKLKIKIKSLAAEARIIRGEEYRRMRGVSNWYQGRYVDLVDAAIEERKQGKLIKFDKDLRRKLSFEAHKVSPPWLDENNRQREDLYRHRTIDIRDEQRAALIAYAYIRGKPFSRVEQNPLAIHVLTPRMKSIKDTVVRLVKSYGATYNKETLVKGLEAWWTEALSRPIAEAMVPVVESKS